MLSDYWIVKKRRYDVPALYDPEGIYKYWVSLIQRSYPDISESQLITRTVWNQLASVGHHYPCGWTSASRYGT